MNNTIKVETKNVYITPYNTHESKVSAENEIIEQYIRENMKNPGAYEIAELSCIMGFIMRNREVIKKALTMRINYE